MKSLISITSVNHCDTYNTFSTPLETEANDKPIVMKYVEC